MRCKRSLRRHDVEENVSDEGKECACENKKDKKHKINTTSLRLPLRSDILEVALLRERTHILKLPYTSDNTQLSDRLGKRQFPNMNFATRNIQLKCFTKS